MNGIVVWFEKKYGFIQYEENGEKKDVFCHYSDIDVSGFKTLKKDQKVVFEIGENYFKKPKAINVKLV